MPEDAIGSLDYVSVNYVSNCIVAVIIETDLIFFAYHTFLPSCASIYCTTTFIPVVLAVTLVCPLILYC